MSSTYASCSDAVEAAFAAVMRSAVRWAVDGEELRLDRPDGRGLRFRVRDSIYRRGSGFAGSAAAATSSAGRRAAG